MRKAPIATAVALSCVLIGQVLVLTTSYASAPTVADRQVRSSALVEDATPTSSPLPATGVRTGGLAQKAKHAAASKPKPKVERRAQPRTTRTHRADHPTAKKTPAHSRRTTTTHRASTGPTSWPALNGAIARIPGYHSGDARWVVKSSAHWGTADWYNDRIYLSPNIPESKLYDVVLHEWSHLLMVRAYAGDVDAAVSAAASYFGGTGLMASEYAADCMARVQGAHWTNYTSCSSPRWRSGARRLINGKHLLT